MRLLKNVKSGIRESLILSLTEEAYHTKIKYLKKPINYMLMSAIVFAIFYSMQDDLYNRIKGLFNYLSSLYSILIGFNISSVIFIVSFLFKEKETLRLFKDTDLNSYYKQIVNSFMLSTIINLFIIVLGIYHLLIVQLISIVMIEVLNSYILFIMNVIYISIWIFAIFSSILVFGRCLTILTRLLRLNHIE